jgi:hypothetical protein
MFDLDDLDTPLDVTRNIPIQTQSTLETEVFHHFGKLFRPTEFAIDIDDAPLPDQKRVISLSDSGLPKLSRQASQAHYQKAKRIVPEEATEPKIAPRTKPPFEPVKLTAERSISSFLPTFDDIARILSCIGLIAMVLTVMT